MKDSTSETDSMAVETAMDASLGFWSYFRVPTFYTPLTLLRYSRERRNQNVEVTELHAGGIRQVMTGDSSQTTHLPRQFCHRPEGFPTSSQYFSCFISRRTGMHVALIVFRRLRSGSPTRSSSRWTRIQGEQKKGELNEEHQKNFT